MIAVLTKEAQRPAVKEFFELFKTPWEYHRPGNEYDVLLCCGTEAIDSSARLVLAYSAERQLYDENNGIQIKAQQPGGFVGYKEESIPIYGNRVTLSGKGVTVLRDNATQETAALVIASNRQTFVRIGFDLFEETRVSLTRGQPAKNSAIPTLELHIAFLRNLIVTFSTFLVEVPPVPANYSFMVCLTHDVDHVAVRDHKWDHTTFGFLYRATIGSLIDACRGRKSTQHLRANWVAALSLPLVHLGLVKDFWNQFDRYLEIEKGLTSTFFVVPTKGDPGQDANGFSRRKRAVAYDLSEIATLLSNLREANREIGLHGIDAWRDVQKARAELEKIKLATSAPGVGVRMHWLYFDEQTHGILEEAGFVYDSTVGYNETIGYRAGTTQVFKPLDVKKLLELPLHIMDTAIFFPAYLDLAPEEVGTAIGPLFENMARFGGVLTVNWHDRSIGPERFWDSAYVNLLQRARREGAWFPTAAQAVSWFQRRRSTTIENIAQDGDTLRIKVSVGEGENDRLPGLRLRVHKNCGQTVDSLLPLKTKALSIDTTFNHSELLSVRL